MGETGLGKAASRSGAGSRARRALSEPGVEERRAHKRRKAQAARGMSRGRRLGPTPRGGGARDGVWWVWRAADKLNTRNGARDGKGTLPRLVTRGIRGPSDARAMPAPARLGVA